MKIAICAPYRTVAPHFETELELAELHLAAGDHVDYLACWSELACCDFNTDKKMDDCHECQGRRLHGISLLSRRLAQRPVGVPVDQLPSKIPNLFTIAELKQLKYEKFDWGYGVLSSLISHVRDPEPDLTQYQELIQRWLRAALQTYLGVVNYIQRHRPDRIYLFNGRFAAMRAVLRACQHQGIECLVHERGCDLNHYALFANEMPHDIPQMHHRIQRHWEAYDPTERERLGRRWFEQRRQRVETNWHSFTKGQVPGKLPDVWPVDSPVITLFGSSDDEFAAIGDCWNNELYPTQWEGLVDLSRILLATAPTHKLCFRMHPNLARCDNASKRRFFNHALPNVFVLPPEDDVDSYAVLEASQAVLTFGSSIGAESIIWGRPTLLLGPCYYQDLPGIVRARSRQDVSAWLANPRLTSDTTGALMYGLWLQTFGTRFQYFTPESLFHGKFKGQVVYNRPPRPWWKLSRLKFWKLGR